MVKTAALPVSYLSQKFGWAAVLTPKLSALTLDLVYGCPVLSNFIGAPTAQQIIGVFYLGCSPQRRRIQGSSQLSCAELFGMKGQFHRSFNQTSVKLMNDQSLSKSDQGDLRKGTLFTIKTIEHQLPTPIHRQSNNCFRIRSLSIRLENNGQR